MLKLEWLKTFSAVVETGNFALAAERIHRTQPAVSQQMAALEKQLDREVYDRGTGTPTPAGQLLYARAQKALAVSRDIEQELADFDERAVPLRIGTNDTSALYVLPSTIRRFREANPEAELDIDCAPSSEVVEMIASNRTDLGVISERPLPDTLEGMAIAENRMRLVVPANSPLSRRKRIALETLRDQDWVLLDPETTTGQTVEAFFRSHDFVPRRALISSSFEVIKRYVADGVGIGVIPEHALADSSELVAVHMTGAPVLRTIAIWPKGRYQTRSATAFLEELRSRD